MCGWPRGASPGPSPLGGRAVGWIEAEVDEWIDESARFAAAGEQPVGRPYGGQASIPLGATLRGSPAGAGGGPCPL